MSLPWNRFPDEEVELPYKPPGVPLPNLPPVAQEEPLPSPTPPEPPTTLPTPPPTGVSSDAKELAANILKEAMDYAKAVLAGTFKGQDIDVTHPTVTAATAAGKELVIADARSRSWRTLVQGLLIDIVAALAVALGTVTSIDPPLDKAAWIAVGILVVKSVIQAVVSYVMRLRITPTVRSEGEKMHIVPLVVPIPEKKGL